MAQAYGCVQKATVHGGNLCENMVMVFESWHDPVTRLSCMTERQIADDP